MFAVTIDTLPGFEIKEVFGEVVGVVARPRNAYVEGVKMLTGGADPNMTTALSRVREGAVAHMLQVAYQRGANAVVGMRFDHRPISESWTEICAYGTAVFVVPMPQPADARGPKVETPSVTESEQGPVPAAGPRAISSRRQK